MRIRVEVKGVEMDERCTFAIVPHDHRQFAVRASAVDVERGMIEWDDADVHGACSLVMIDARGRRSVIAHGFAGKVH